MMMMGQGFSVNNREDLEGRLDKIRKEFHFFSHDFQKTTNLNTAHGVHLSCTIFMCAYKFVQIYDRHTNGWDNFADDMSYQIVYIIEHHWNVKKTESFSKYLISIFNQDLSNKYIHDRFMEYIHNDKQFMQISKSFERNLKMRQSLNDKLHAQGFRSKCGYNDPTYITVTKKITPGSKKEYAKCAKQIQKIFMDVPKHMKGTIEKSNKKECIEEGKFTFKRINIHRGLLV